MKKFYSLFLMLALVTMVGRAQNVAILADPEGSDPVVWSTVLQIQTWVEDAWTGITTDLVDVAGITDWDAATWGQYDAVVMTESGGSASHGHVSPIGVKTCPIVCLKAYAIKKAWPSWNLISGDATSWYQMPKDSSQVDYDFVYKGVVAADHPIFGGYWGVGDEFTWNKFVDELVAGGTTTVDGWLWAMEAVPDSSYKKTVIWGIHHRFMDNATDTFRIILQNSMAWVLGHDIPNVYVPQALNDHQMDYFDVTINPNPVVSRALVKFNVQEPMTVSAFIHDVSGRVIYSNTGAYQAGKQQMSIDVSSMAPGVYTCQLVGKEYTESVRFVVE
jgi:hypothetical protein